MPRASPERTCARPPTPFPRRRCRPWRRRAPRGPWRFRRRATWPRPGSTTASLTASDSGVSAACSSFPPPALPSTTQNLCTRRCPARLRSDRTIVSLCASTHAQRSQCSPGLCVYTTRTSVASGSSLFDTSTPRFSGCVGDADAMATTRTRERSRPPLTPHTRNRTARQSGASRARLALTPRLVARSARRQTRAGRRAHDPSPAAPRRPSPGGSPAPRVRRSGRRRRATKSGGSSRGSSRSAVSQGSVASRGNISSLRPEKACWHRRWTSVTKSAVCFPRNRPTRSRGV